MDSQGLGFIVAFGVSLLVFLAWEITQWRSTGAVLSRRQRVLRVANVGILTIIVALMWVTASGKIRTPRGLMIALGAIALLTLVVLALAMRDMRELRATRLATEMRLAGELARAIAAETRRKAQSDEACQESQN